MALPPDPGRQAQIASLLEYKLDKLNLAIRLLARRGRSTTSAELELSRCVSWLQALMAGSVPASTWPTKAEDAQLLEAIHAVDTYVATSGAVSALVTAVNKLIATYP